MPLSGDFQSWAVTHKQGAYRDMFATLGLTHAPHSRRDCASCEAVADALRPRMGERPIVFRTKRDGVWVDVAPDIADQRLVRFAYEVHAYICESLGGTVTETPSAAPVAAPKPKPAPAAPKPSGGLSAAQTRFLAEVRRLRAFATDRDIDHISYRPVKDGMRMIAAGISVEGCVHAMTMHWDDADRRQAGIRAYDPMTDHPGGMDAYLDCLVRARVAIYLYGPAGMGKSYWAEQLAELRGVDFGFTPMTEGATVSWLLGRVDAQGFKPTKLLKIWRDGGVYLFDEADAADPNMLLVMNGPLANERLDNPVDQETYMKSSETILIFAGNTDGTGADRQYNARNPFDFSTFDRLRMGRAHIRYDERVEDAVALANASV